MNFPYASKTVVVLGLGTSGLPAAHRLLEEGACVTVLDTGDTEKLRKGAEILQKDGARVRLGKDALADTSAYARAVLSPGIASTTPLYKAIVKRGIPIIGELEMSYTLCECPVVAITGTNGKTTTTQLVERMLNSCRTRTMAAGNIGPSFAARVRESENLDVMTLEVSSFQLEAIKTFRPRVAVWLNFQADHLDRYASMKEYFDAKVRIFENQTEMDYAVVKLEDDANRLPPLKAHKITFSAYKEGGDFDLREGVIHYHGKPVMDMSQTFLRGQHNAENVMAALGVGCAWGLEFDPMVDSLRTYKPLPHRCEIIGVVDGVQYVNDSKATNLDALEKALLAEQRPVVLIAGGKDKGFEFDSIADVVAAKAHSAILIGEMAANIEKSWSRYLPCKCAVSLDQAVTLARGQAKPGDVVLFSPGTSSFDMFKSYVERGNKFRDLVKAYFPSVDIK
jgi:UDP-N-acetylmuramoylalanine--D-glutamate ligase